MSPILLLALVVAAPVAQIERAEPPPRELRYDLETGDRLVYRETVTREREDRRGRTVVEAEWTSEVLVLGTGPQGALVGIQRRRLRAEPTGAAGDGEGVDRAPSSLAWRLGRPLEVVAEANVYDDRGGALLATTVEREWLSDLQPFVHEIVALPETPVAPGAEWNGTHPLGLEFRAETWEDVGGESCLRVRGGLPGNRVALRLWYAAPSAVLRRVELEGRYPTAGGQLHEEVRFELLERWRGESPEAWLDAPERRLGVLAAWLIVDSLPVDTDRIQSLLAQEDPAVRRAALRLLYRRRVAVPTPALAPLLESPHSRVRALAARMLDRTPAGEARPLVESALADPDVFVRDAALHWLRRRLPPVAARALDESAHSPDAWDLIGSSPPARDGPLTSIAATVRAGGTVADWRCDAPTWSDQALLQQRLPPELPGARLQAMTSGKWGGHPYVVRVPDEYRGDHPAPLLIYLGGGPSHALLGWRSAATAVDPTGYLAVFPQASGMWWSDESEELVRLLLLEILGRFNVDTNRVYLAGSSNGGTGTYRYAVRWADLLAAAVSLEGAGKYVDEESLPPPGGAGRLPFLFVHGDEDRVVPVMASRDSVELLKRENRGARVELVILPGRGHDLGLGTEDGMPLEFLERHRRDPFPRQVAFALGDLRTPRRYWIEVLEKARGVARVEGAIRDDGTVALKTERVGKLRLLLRRELLPKVAGLRVVVNGKEAYRGSPVEDCQLLQRSWHATKDPFRAYSIEIPLTVR